MNSSQSRKVAAISMCLKCGKPVEPIYINGSWATPLCSCERKIKQEEALVTYERLRLKSISENVLGINPKVKNCTFDNFLPREEADIALYFAKDYTANIEESIKSGKGITLMGGYGTGKSHLSGAIANAALRGGFVVVFEVITEMFSKIKNTFYKEETKGSNTSELTILESLCSCDLLILDDLGAEKTSAWTESIIYTIVNNRYVSKKPIIITTNLETDELPGKIGDRTLDRLIEMNRFVKLTGESYRKVIARERLREENYGDL